MFPDQTERQVTLQCGRWYSESELSIDKFETLNQLYHDRTWQGQFFYIGKIIGN